MTRYTPAWSEHGMPGGRNAAGSWQPVPWDQARRILAGQLARNLDRWPGTSKRDGAAYALVLTELLRDDVPEPRPGTGWSRRLAFHILTITPED